VNGYFEQTYVLRVENVDANGEWRIGEIFCAMQAVAEGQSVLFSLGLEAMHAHNLAWVVTRARLTLARALRLGETVTMRTWPAQPKHMFFPRYFQLFAQDEPVGSAVMLYVQLDLSTRRMGKPWLGGHVAPVCDLPPPLPLPGGIPALAAPARVTERVANYSDLDINGHVNNARYLDWFFDCFPMEHHRARRLTDVLIHYEREITPDETTSLSLIQEGAQSVLRGTGVGGNCFSVYGIWEERG
jgi:medium-chain acyl-[acyl-carrier-protein] hydrolase